MGLGEWDFCLKLLSAPTKTLSLLFEAHTHAEYQAKITSIQSIYHLFNAIILIFYSVLCYWFMLLVFMKAAY